MRWKFRIESKWKSNLLPGNVDSRMLPYFGHNTHYHVKDSFYKKLDHNKSLNLNNKPIKSVTINSDL